MFLKRKKLNSHLPATGLELDTPCHELPMDDQNSTIMDSDREIEMARQDVMLACLEAHGNENSTAQSCQLDAEGRSQEVDEQTKTIIDDTPVQSDDIYDNLNKDNAPEDMAAIEKDTFTMTHFANSDDNNSSQISPLKSFTSSLLEQIV